MKKSSFSVFLGSELLKRNLACFLWIFLQKSLNSICSFIPKPFES